VLVFSSFTENLQRLQLNLTGRGIATLGFHSKVSPLERARNFLKFQQQHTRVSVFLMSSRMASCGLTLTAATCVVMMEPQHLAGLEQQAMDRVHRIGQARDVVVHRLVSTLPTASGAESIEQRMITQQSSGIVGGAAGLRANDRSILRNKELQRLLFGVEN
jgi:superfamily II DNA/RNA helicase